MHRKRRLKYIGAIGKHGFVVKIKYSTEAINLIIFLIENGPYVLNQYLIFDKLISQIELQRTLRWFDGFS